MRSVLGRQSRAFLHPVLWAQAHLLMMVDKPGADLRMPGGLMEAARRTWLASARNVRVSALHREVSRLLGERGVAHTIEHLTDDQLFSVDIALAGERLRLSLMADILAERTPGSGERVLPAHWTLVLGAQSHKPHTLTCAFRT